MSFDDVAQICTKFQSVFVKLTGHLGLILYIDLITWYRTRWKEPGALLE